ncbi:MAG: calcineurin-like phosphoesterase C-terminal domain-containing protein [Alistipes sp.]|nr:calcineurin-like phosphoesterase C-terminal domain-containing protein [Alistipes sp.]
MKIRHILLTLLVSATLTAHAAAHRAQSDLPVGTTVYGRVTCQGEPVAGVTISDGALFTETDAEGRYALQSLKFYGSIFIITPSGYEPVCEKGVMPRFWASLNTRKPAKCEQHDFELIRRDNERHRLIVASDPALSNRNEDLLQFKRIFMPAVRRVAEQAKRDSLPIYSIVLGDLSVNSNWYSAEFDVDDARNTFISSRYPTPLYTAIGERDHDGAVPSGVVTDYLSEQMYVECCGPRFYSMNIGRVHYVVLDNTVFRNEPGNGKYPSEIVGKRNFDRRVSADQLSWLRRDLARVEDKSRPIVVCMHHNTIRTSNRGLLVKSLTKEADADSLIACFRDFKNVRLLTGHSARRRISAPKELPNIVEHSICSISGNGWESVVNGFPHICADGTDGGFELFTMDGDSCSWQFHSLLNGERTFRAYDMNEVGKHYRTDEDTKQLIREHSTRTNYGASSFADYVYINWWGDEPGATLEVSANGKTLKAKRIYQDDPLFTQASTVVRLRNARGRRQVSFSKNNCQHLYRVKADSTMTTIHIRTKDPFGRIFEDSLVRPAPFPQRADFLKRRR